MSFRTDRHNNPTAFTTDIAKEGGLVEGTDYSVGESFDVGNSTFYTARLLHDPVELTVQVIDKIGFWNRFNQPRWIYVRMPSWVWSTFTFRQKKDFIAYMYRNEGGTELKNLFE